ncbi:hypothetical protein GCM10009634_51680 [Saccharothrix xinjiangensis]
MPTTLAEVVRTTAEWLPTLTSIAEAATAVIGLVLAVDRLAKWWRARRG